MKNVKLTRKNLILSVPIFLAICYVVYNLGVEVGHWGAIYYKQN